MLPSEELLNKYRTAEKSGASEPAPVSAEAGTEKEPSAPETKTDGEQPATVAGDQGQGTTTQTPKEDGADNGHTVAPKESKDEWSRHQKEWEKRFKRQERSHQRVVDDLKKQLADALAKLPKEPELKAEDFSNRKDWDDYNQRRMAESIEANILEKQRAQKEAEEADRRKNEEAEQKLAATFKTPERVQQFRDTLNDFYEDEGEYLESEEGQLFQEFCDNSPVGLFMVEQIAKNDNVIKQMKGWSKDMLFYQLQRFETGLKNQIKAAKDAAKAKTAKPEKANPPAMPSTGPIGKTTTAAGKFSAIDWLRKNHPERYRK